MKLAADLVRICTDKGVTVSSCESLTAGLFTSTIASIPGASAVLMGGLVTYFTEMKKVLAHVDEDLIKKYGVISSECSIAMAKNTLEIVGSNYCVSFTGNAGPSSMEDKPAGCVYCSIASKKGVKTFHFQCDDMQRNTLREYIVEQMIDHLANLIEKE